VVGVARADGQEASVEDRSDRPQRVLWAVGLCVLLLVPTVLFVEGNPATPGVALARSRDPRELRTEDRATSTGGTSGGSSPLSASIVAPAREIDAGRPFPIRANVSGGVPPYSEEWRDSLNQLYTGTSYTAVVPLPGSYSTTLFVLDSAGQLLEANRTFPVEPPPAVQVFALRTTVDVGVPFPLNLTITGGVGPFSLEWGLDPNISAHSTVIDRPGNVTERPVPSSPGPVWVTIDLRDLLGASVGLTTAVAEAVPPPRAAVLWTSPSAEVGVPLGLTVQVANGTPPFGWTVRTQSAYSNSTQRSGTLGSWGEINWSATFTFPGSVNVSLELTDAAGSALFENDSFEIRPALGVQLATNASTLWSNSSFPLAGLISGGSPPYNFTILWDGVDSLSGNLSATGSLVRNLTTGPPGVHTVELVVSDALGGNATASLELLVSSRATDPPSPPIPASTSSTASTSGSDGLPLLLVPLVVISGAIAGAVAFLGWRRRSSSRPMNAVDMFGTVGSILRSAGEVTRANLIAQTDGLGLDRGEVELAVNILEEQGQVRRSRPGDLPERYQWVDARSGPDTGAIEGATP
jgi:hypothetical protein